MPTTPQIKHGFSRRREDQRPSSPDPISTSCTQVAQDRLVQNEKVETPK